MRRLVVRFIDVFCILSRSHRFFLCSRKFFLQSLCGRFRGRLRAGSASIPLSWVASADSSLIPTSIEL